MGLVCRCALVIFKAKIPLDFDEIIIACSGSMVLWLFLPKDDTASNFIHRCFQQETWRESGWRRRLAFIIAFLFWPLTVAALSGIFTLRNGRAVKHRNGTSIPRQVAGQLRVAVANAMLPPWYYIYGLYDREHWIQRRQYLNRFEVKRGIYNFLRQYNSYLPRASADSMAVLSNKALFSVHCEAHGLATVPVLMIMEKGRVIYSAASGEALPQIDLFLKRQRGSGGRGAERWEYIGGKHYRDANGRVLNATALLEHIKQLSLVHKRGFLVQPRLVNHPGIADLSNGALTTVRVLTCWNEHGHCEVCNAVFRMAQGTNTVVDNAHAGGIVAKVYVDQGVIGRGIDGAMGVGGKNWCESHPETGARFEGRVLPYWKETVALTTRTHAEAFPDMVVVGWDVALLEDGPRLIEGNKRPDLDLMQMGYGAPFGNARLGELLAYNLQCALKVKYGSA